MSPAVAPSQQELTRLRTKLFDGDYDVRELAAREMTDLGNTLTASERESLRRPMPFAQRSAFLPDLQDPLAQPRVVHRIPVPILLPLEPRLRRSRANTARERSSAPAAKQLLRELASGAAISPLTREAKAARAH